MKKFFVILCLVLLIFLSIGQVKAEKDSCQETTSCSLESEKVGGDQDFEKFRPTNQENKVCVYYFFGAGCQACAALRPFMEDLAGQKVNQVELKSFEVFYSEENRALFDDFNRRYEVEKVGVPAVFIGDTYLGGAEVIKENLAGKIDYFYEHKTQCPLDYNRIQGETEQTKKLKLTIAAIIVGAAADSINPCAFAVLIFLLVYLLTVKDKRRMFQVGLVYIAVVFMVYFISGLGILQLARYLTLTRWIIWIAASISIITGLINIKDFFWYGKGISLQIPESKKHLIEKYVKKATIPAAVVLGFLVSAFELPCTGGVYLAILGILAQDANRLLAVVYLFIYNLIFVLPLLLILLLIYKGLDPEKINSWRLTKRKWLRLSLGLVMLLLGVGLLFGVW